MTKEGHRRIFWGDGNDLYISCSAIYMGSYLCQRLSNSTLKIYVLDCSCGSWATEFGAQWLWCVGLVATACGIFPDQGSHPCLLHCKADSCPPEKSLDGIFSKEMFTSYSRRKTRNRNKKVMEWMYRYLWFDKSDSGLS